MGFKLTVFSSICLLLAFTFSIVGFGLLLSRKDSNDAKQDYLLKCALDGSCVGGDVHATTVIVVAEPVSSSNVQWTNVPIQEIDAIQTNGTFTIQTFMGSNILINGTEIRMTQAIVVDNLYINGNVLFGGNTSCMRPIDSSCLNISTQSCRSPLLLSCLPANASFDTLTIEGGIFINTNDTNLLETPSTVDVSNLVVTDNISVQNLITCGMIDNSCINLGLFQCNVTIDSSCIPSSLPFYDVNVDHTLVLNETQCLGPPMSFTTCISGILFQGDLNGTWFATQLSGFQKQNVVINSLTASSTLTWNTSNWKNTAVTSLTYPPFSIMSRNVDQNSSAATLVTNTATIQSTECIGVGQTVTEDPESHIYYMTVSREVGATTAYNSPYHDDLFTYNAITKTTSYIGIATGYVGGDNTLDSTSIYMHPNGTLYGQGDNTARLYQINKTNAVLTPVCYGLLPGVYFKAFDYLGYFYATHSNGTLWKCDLTQCSCIISKVFSSSPEGRTALIIGSTMYVHSAVNQLSVYDIRPTTSTTVTLKSTLPVWNGLVVSATAARIYSQCINEKQFIGTFKVATSSNTTAFDPLSLNLVPSQFYWTNNGVPGVAFTQCSPVTPGQKCYYPWGIVTSRCFTPYPAVGGSCTEGNLTVNNHNVNRTDGIFVGNIYSNNNNAITLNANMNFGTHSLTFTNGGSFYQSGSSLTISPTSLLDVSGYYIQASRFISSLGGISLTAGPGAGTTTPATLTATNARRCLWQVSVTTTASPSPNSVIFTVHIAGQTNFAPGIVFSPVVQNSVQLATNARPYVTNETISGFDFMSGSTALTGATNYRWNFQNCI